MVRKELTRKVRFYQLHLQKNIYRNVEGKRPRYKNLSSDRILEAFQKIASLPKVVNASPDVVLSEEDINRVREYLNGTRYLALREYSETVEVNGRTIEAPRRFLFMDFDYTEENKENNIDYPIRGRLILIKVDALPVITDDHGRTKIIKITKNDLGVSEVTHFMIFEDGTLIFEFNPNGAGTGLFKVYLIEKCRELGCEDVNRIHLKPISNEKEIKELLDGKKEKTFKVIQLGFAVNKKKKKDNKNRIRDQDEDDLGWLRGLFGWAIGLVKDTTRKATVYVTLSSGVYLLDDIKLIYERIPKSELKKFKVTSINGHDYNLLGQYIEYRLPVIQVDPKSRVVDSKSMFKEMEDAYRDYKNR